MKSRFIPIVLILMLWLVLFTGCRSGNQNLEFDFQVGYDGVVKLSDGNPITVNVKNFGKDFTGEIEMDIHKNGGEQITIAETITVASNSEKTITIYVPFYMVQKNLDVRVVSGNATVYEEAIDIGRTLAPDNLIVGVVSDEPDAYRFFSSMALTQTFVEDIYSENYYNFTDYEDTELDIREPYIIYLDDLSVFDDYDALQFMNLIYVGDSTDLGINETTEENILTWIESGNIFIVETGEDYKKVTSQLPASLTNFNFTGTTSNSYLLNIYDTSEEQVSIVTATGTYNNMSAEEILFNEKVFGYLTMIGRGRLISLNMDYSKEPLKTENASGKILQEILLHTTNYAYDEYYEDYDYEIYNQIQYIPADKNPPFPIMLIVLVFYIIIVGPVLYAVLKKMDKRDYMWFTVPAVAMSCLLILYLIGFTTRFSKPISNNISKISYTSGDTYMSVDSTLGLFNNKNSNMKITWLPSDNLEISSDSDNYYWENREVKTTVGILHNGNEPLYETFEAALWSPIIAEAEKVIPIETQEAINATIFFEEEGISIEVTNPLPVDIEYAFAVWGGEFYHIGDLPSGETVTGRASSASYLSDYFYQEYGYYYYDASGVDMDTRNALNMMELIDSAYFDYYSGNYSDATDMTVKVYGMNTQDIGYNIKINGDEVEAYNKNIYELSFDPNFITNDAMVLPYGFVSPEMSQEVDGYIEEAYTNYDIVNSIDLYNVDAAFAKWTLPKFMTVDSISIQWTNDYTYDYFYRNVNEGEVEFDPNISYDPYVYNYKTLEWDRANFDDSGIMIVNMENYVSAQDEVRIKYEFFEKDINGDRILMVPEISLQGGGKND